MSGKILEYLDPQAICLRADAADAAGVIALLGARLEALGKVKPSYIGAATTREETMPTGLPLGEINIAVPHTDVEHVLLPAIALATLRTPVAFGSMDDPDEKIPIQIVVALALTDKNAQIEMLQSIAGLIQTPAALAALVAAETIADVQAALNAAASGDK